MAKIHFRKAKCLAGDYWQVYRIELEGEEKPGCRLSLILQEYLVVSGDIAGSEEQKGEAFARLRKEMRKDGHSLHYHRKTRESA